MRKPCLGQRFGRLLVVAEADSIRFPNGSVARQVLVYCDCGTEKLVILKNLRAGITTSCGCFQRREVKVRQVSGYRSWQNLKDRCLNPANPAYSSYGGRGITVASEWIDSFDAFLAHIGPRPGPKYSVDRIDNDGNYEPGNVRWATAREQNLNRGRRGRRLTHA